MRVQVGLKDGSVIQNELQGVDVVQDQGIVKAVLEVSQVESRGVLDSQHKGSFEETLDKAGLRSLAGALERVQPVAPALTILSNFPAPTETA